MKIKKILYFFFILIFFLLFNIIFIAIRFFFESGIIFYQGLFSIATTALIFVPTFFIYKKFVVEMLGYFLFSIMLCYSFLITVPTLLDRSISLYILATIYAEKKINKEGIEDYFVKGFVKKNKAIDKRLQEQIFTKNIIINQDSYQITERGAIVNKLNIFLSNIYNTDKNYLKPRK